MAESDKIKRFLLYFDSDDFFQQMKGDNDSV